MAIFDINVNIEVRKFLRKLINQNFQQLTEKIMGKFEELKAEFDGLKEDIAAEKQQIADKLQSLGDKITQLETNILEGGTTEERAALIADIKAEREGIKAIIPDLPPPTGGEEPAPGEGENPGSGEPV